MILGTHCCRHPHFSPVVHTYSLPLSGLFFCGYSLNLPRGGGGETMISHNAMQLGSPSRLAGLFAHLHFLFPRVPGLVTGKWQAGGPLLL